MDEATGSAGTEKAVKVTPLADSIAATLELRGTLLRSRAKLFSSVVASLAEVGQSIVDNRARALRSVSASEPAGEVRKACAEHLDHVATSLNEAAAELRSATK